MASATHLSPTSPFSVMVPNPRRGIFRPLLSVTSGIEFSRALVSGAAYNCARPRPRNIAEAANPALVCRNWRRSIPLELRSLFIGGIWRHRSGWPKKIKKKSGACAGAVVCDIDGDGERECDVWEG